MKTKTALLVLVMAIVLGASFVYAAEDVVVISREASERSDSALDLQSLKPVVNPLKPPDTSRVQVETGTGLHPAGVMTKGGIVEEIETRAYGSFGIPYTTTRVQDGARSGTPTEANRLSTTSPYRTVGKLTFSAGFCSASLIRRSVIVTAAHCIQRFGSGNSIFTGFTFRPGHYGATGATATQMAPYGTYTWAALVRPASWANGTDTGSGSARDNDLAVIALNKSGGVFAGDRAGWLGYGWNNYSFVTSSKTGNQRTAAVSTLGYPGLMDLGRIMQRTDGPSYLTTISGAGQIWQGSNFTGGSSGGPWVVNFRSRSAALSGGAADGTASVTAVIGVTSWGSRDPNAPKDNYSSQFRQNSRYPNANYGGRGAGNIGSLLNTLCSAPAPGGGTFASQGYCN